ncbi:MAG: inorganic phosphate transporter [Bacteroidota bacterium]|nr:inorganic phosphate transporter [Bacteroidota bacterium]
MTFVIVIILLALIFDYINGFHDAANSIATVVSTKVLTPFQAVLWAAFFNFVAYLIFKDHAVANTIAKTVNKDFITLPVIFSGLIASIFWNLLTWWYGIPSSSSHTLIGGFAGAAIAHAFIQHGGYMPLKDIIDSGKVLKTISFILLAPLIGMVMAMFFTFVTIARNTWIKCAILLATCVVFWFSFRHFQEVKMDENIEKFFKVDKLKIDVEKDPSKKDKLAKAVAYADASKPYVHAYEANGGEYVANEIFTHVPMTDAQNSKAEEKLKNFFKVDQLKIISKRDTTRLDEYEDVQMTVDSLKQFTKNYSIDGYDKMMANMLATKLIPASQKIDFKEAMKVDVKKDIAKELSKADNKIIRYGLIAMLLIFILSFIYTEKIKEVSASRQANMFKRLQLLSSAAFSIGHGGNDAQKVMGIIAAALVANGTILDIKSMPDWVPLACYTAISLGTLTGGWKIVKTMGTRITKVTPLEGVCAETAGATTLFLTEQMGIPVSTTHTITGSIIGVGATKRLSAVRWGVTVNLLWAWILTIPISGLLAALTYYIVHLIL